MDPRDQGMILLVREARHVILRNLGDNPAYWNWKRRPDRTLLSVSATAIYISARLFPLHPRLISPRPRDLVALKRRSGVVLSCDRAGEALSAATGIAEIHDMFRYEIDYPAQEWYPALIPGMVQRKDTEVNKNLWPAVG